MIFIFFRPVFLPNKWAPIFLPPEHSTFHIRKSQPHSVTTSPGNHSSSPPHHEDAIVVICGPRTPPSPPFIKEIVKLRIYQSAVIYIVCSHSCRITGLLPNIQERFYTQSSPSFWFMSSMAIHIRRLNNVINSSKSIFNPIHWKSYIQVSEASLPDKFISPFTNRRDFSACSAGVTGHINSGVRCIASPEFGLLLRFMTPPSMWYM
ncbi:hypothetical protein LXL04_030276 [Taraxacum kok-saghyz]